MLPPRMVAFGSGNSLWLLFTSSLFRTFVGIFSKYIILKERVLAIHPPSLNL